MKLASALLVVVFLLPTLHVFAAPTATVTQPVKRATDDSTNNCPLCNPKITITKTSTTTVSTSSTTTWAGPCQAETVTIPSSCPTAHSPYSAYFLPNVDWDSGCQIMQFCNSTNFNGTCMSVPSLVGKSDGNPCVRRVLDTCISMPAFGDDNNFTIFQQNYGESLQTLSIRPGDGLACATFSDNHCMVPAIRRFTGEGYSDITQYKLLGYFGSFQCWAEQGPRPDYQGTASGSWTITSLVTLITPTLSSTMSPTTISVAMASASALEVELGSDYFNPFFDELLVCGYQNATQCVARNMTGDGCTDLYDVSQDFHLDTVSVVAAGYGHNCVLYDDKKCTNALVTVSDSEPQSFTASATMSLASWYFSCAWAQCDPGSGYSGCTDTIVPSATTIVTTLYPVPVMRTTSTWSRLGWTSQSSSFPINTGTGGSSSSSLADFFTESSPSTATGTGESSPGSEVGSTASPSNGDTMSSGSSSPPSTGTVPPPQSSSSISFPTDASGTSSTEGSSTNTYSLATGTSTIPTDACVTSFAMSSILTFSTTDDSGSSTVSLSTSSWTTTTTC